MEEVTEPSSAGPSPQRLRRPRFIGSHVDVIHQDKEDCQAAEEVHAVESRPAARWVSHFGQSHLLIILVCGL
jgi:hypothetical protein